MDYAVGVTTAPRPTPTLDRTLASLRRAGWPHCDVLPDTRCRGAWRNWIEGLQALLRRYPHADAYLISQDDVVFCDRLRDYLRRTLWPAEPASVALCSLFTPAAYRVPRLGWHTQRRGRHLVAAQAWVIPPESARAIVADLGSVEASKHIDNRIGEWAERNGRMPWYHMPSLAEHIGLRNSSLGDDLISDLRISADFIGEENEP